jgi:GxxExxY protein
MPIRRPFETVRIDQEEFKLLAYEVMRIAYGIHNEYGRYFDEVVYKRELADRLPGLEIELPLTVSYGNFSKTYWLDALWNWRGLFELKAVERLTEWHQGQTINYLLLADMAHGKLINFRPDRVDSKFVNCHQRLVNLRNPRQKDEFFDPAVPGGEFFRETLTALAADWGAALEITLFEQALTFFLGGDERALFDVPVFGSKRQLHKQKMRLLAPEVAFKLTAFTDSLDPYAAHLRKLLAHTGLKAIHWANITGHELTFTTIKRQKYER